MLVRFADDLVMAFETFDDAERVLAVLGKRLARYGLTLQRADRLSLHRSASRLDPDKTRFIDFRPQRPEGEQSPGQVGPRSTFSASPTSGGGR
jgi:hypothetical protein